MLICGFHGLQGPVGLQGSPGTMGPVGPRGPSGPPVSGTNLVVVSRVHCRLKTISMSGVRSLLITNYPVSVYCLVHRCSNLFVKYSLISDIFVP